MRRRTFLDRLVASLASTPLSQLYFDWCIAQKSVVAERSRSENPSEMSIMAYMYILECCDGSFYKGNK